MYKVVVEGKDFPNPTDVTEKQIEDILSKYDLPAFPNVKKMGHSTIFHNEEQHQMLAYLGEMCNMGLPRTRQEFQLDVRLYYLSKTEDEEDPKDYVFSEQI